VLIDLGDFDAEGHVSVVEVARRLRSALDVERVTKSSTASFRSSTSPFWN
jgi:hypothetical protein